MKSKGAALFLCLLYLTVFWSGCNSSQVEGDYSDSKPVVVVAEVHKSDLQEVVVLTGQVSPSVDVKVLPEVPGRVEEVVVQVGDKVDKGQLLIQIANQDQMLQLQQARAALKMAEAQLAEVNAGAREQDMEQLRQGLAAAELNYEQAKKEYFRMEELFEAGYISAQQLEGVKLQTDLAETQYLSAQSRLSMAEEGARVETLKMAEAQVEQARVAVEMADSLYQKTLIKAPVKGTAAVVNLNEGDMASPTMPAVILVDLETVHIRAALPEGAVNRVEEGLKVGVYVPAVGSQPFEGVVEEISPISPEGGRNYPVKIVMDNLEELLKGGMYARVEVPVEKREQVIVIPLEALVLEDGCETVLVVEEGKAARKVLEPGIRSEKFVEITAGLKVGDKVIVKGQRGLLEGMEVEVLEEDRK